MSEKLQLKFKRLSEGMTVPTKAHDTDACFDLYADLSSDVKDGMIVIPPHGMVKIHTGFATEIPVGYWGAIYPRSGIATKQHLRLANCTGI